MTHNSHRAPARKRSRRAAPDILGLEIETYGKSRSVLVLGGLAVALVAAFGVFVIVGGSGIGATSYGGLRSLLYQIGAGALIISAVLGFILLHRLTSHPTFGLFEKGIRATGAGVASTALYADIEDLFVFSQGGLAYRDSTTGPWVCVSTRVSRFKELSHLLRSRQVKQRSGMLYDQLLAGATIGFRYVDDGVASTCRLSASRWMNYPVAELTLSRHELSIAGKCLPLERLRAITLRSLMGKIHIHDIDGALFHSCQANAIFSLEVLCALTAKLQNERSA